MMFTIKNSKLLISILPVKRASSILPILFFMLPLKRAKSTLRSFNVKSFSTSSYYPDEKSYSANKLAYRLKKYEFTKSEIFNFVNLYENNFTFTPSAYFQFNPRTGCWFPIEKSLMMEHLLKGYGLEPARWLQAIRVMVNAETVIQFERKQNDSLYFLQRNRTFICVTYHKGKFDVRLSNLKDLESLDKIKSCHFTEDYFSNFNLSEAECDELTFKLNKAFGNTSKKDYYDKYNTLCPKILKFIRDLNSYYDKDNESNVCYETSGNILNWLILLVFKSLSQQANKLTYTNVNKVLSISGASKGGKSQLTTLMRILGTGSVATGSFARLKERFESSGWYNKAAIIFHEVAVDHSNMDTIYAETKMLTGRDPIRVEHKYGNITDAIFTGLVILVSQQRLPIPESDFVALSRRFSNFIVEESTYEPVNDFANEVLAKEVLPFTILTLFLTCDLEANSWDGLSFNEKFLKELTNKINTYNLDTIMLSTIDTENNTHNDYLFRHVDQATILAMQFEVTKVGSDRSIALYELAALYYRQVLTYQSSKVVIKDFNQFQYDFIQLFKSDSRTEWSKFEIFTKDHMLSNLNKIRDTYSDSSMTALLTPVLDANKTIPEKSIWDNFLTLMLNRVEHLRLLGFKMGKWDTERKLVKSVETLPRTNSERLKNGEEFKQRETRSLMLFVNITPYDTVAKQLVDDTCPVSKIDIMKKPLLHVNELSSNIVENYTGALKGIQRLKRVYVTFEFENTGQNISNNSNFIDDTGVERDISNCIDHPVGSKALTVENLNNGFSDVNDNLGLQKAEKKLKVLKEELQAAIIQNDKRLIHNKRMNIRYWKTKIKDE